jgi:hypothetical protein
MKNRKINHLRNSFLLTIITLVNFNCERDLSDEAKEATFPKTAEVFTDAPVGMGTNFYFPYGPDANNPVGSKFSAWTVDQNVSYKGTASMRFDVPNATDSQGNYAGGILRIDGAGRNLTEFDALTFWAKASQGVTIGEIGFGEDFYPNKYITTMTNISLGTAWTKYIIPIPNASKLLQEKGMLRYSAGTSGTNGLGYTFWIDELKFEKLGTILPLQASIMNGNNITRSTFVSVTSSITGALATFNMPNGTNQSVSISPAFLNFTSSNPSVATVNDAGVVTPIAAGTATITATFNGLPATGSLIINCLGAFVSAPLPTLNPSNVISVFSNTYSNVPVDYFNGYWGGSQTLSDDFIVNGDNVLSYYNFLYFGIAFSNPFINATNMDYMHLDIHVPASNTSTNKSMRIRIRDFGANGIDNQGNFDDTDKTMVLNNANLVSNSWNSIEIPMNIANKSRLGLIIFDQGTNLSKFYIDNIYFHN